jgi:Protein of unknown function (DUF4240)
MSTAAIKVPVKALNPDFVRNLQEHYPDAQVTVTVSRVPVARKMKENTFWALIGFFDWGRKRPEDIIAATILQLSTYPESDIFAFDECLAQKLHALDTELLARQTGWAADNPTSFSVDGFLYARCAVVANGKAFYTKVVKNPALMPPDSSFEAILYIAEKAYRLKTGSDNYDYLPNVSYETFANAKGWPNGPKLALLVTNLPNTDLQPKKP